MIKIVHRLKQYQTPNMKTTSSKIQTKLEEENRQIKKIEIRIEN
jgi:hypothetical protein